MINWINDFEDCETFAIVGQWFINRERITVGSKMKYITYYYAHHPVYGTMETSNWQSIKKIILLHSQLKLF